jgi:hypothetical protein
VASLSKSDIVDLACLLKSDGALTERFHVLSLTTVDGRISFPLAKSFAKMSEIRQLP